METLPDELTTRVLGHLESHDLVNAALVNIKLASVTSTVLYKSCSIAAADVGSQRDRLVSLLRTLLAYPDLQKTVKSAQIDIWLPGLPEQDAISSFSESDISSLTVSENHQRSLPTRPGLL